ncbi:MAG TPA: hypothetical protein VFS77_12265, partial [Pyrinomonadaceae bacterium]|nr:hypothetical protein [Pyrinomonadaceae bacterium]
LCPRYGLWPMKYWGKARTSGEAHRSVAAPARQSLAAHRAAQPTKTTFEARPRAALTPVVIDANAARK